MELARLVRRAQACSAASFLVACVLVAAPAVAQGPPAHDFQTYRPSLPATHISEAEAPTIDGDVSDPIWQKAPALDEFYQLEPHEGAPADERTVVHVLYDDKNI